MALGRLSCSVALPAANGAWTEQPGPLRSILLRAILAMAARPLAASRERSRTKQTAATPPGRSKDEAAEEPVKPGARPNDGQVSRQGRTWAGRRQGTGALRC